MDDYGTECSCNHLTHFAVLVQFDANAGGSNSLLTKVRPNSNMFRFFVVVVVLSEILLKLVLSMHTYPVRMFNMDTSPCAQSSNLCEAEVICLFTYLFIYLFIKADESTLIILTRVGLVLSLVGITLTIICYVFLAWVPFFFSVIMLPFISGPFNVSFNCFVIILQKFYSSGAHNRESTAFILSMSLPFHRGSYL